ncbi:MAG: spore coat protein YlbD [Bacilli bacterium]|nr:spore coat protein YlbD [Bacilli bacterium]MDD4282484.1 spore coat protein YlbD [Bacilli bacterium]MDD4718850.1 spore coat protein YlbD [Bacilli bacterium]
MDKLGAFKEFVKQNPGLIKYVKSNEMTWQKFYEIYDLYGSDDSIWTPYIASDRSSDVTTAAASAIGFNDIINWFKTVDVNTLQSGINNVQRVVGVLQDFTGKEKTEPPKEEYKPRPLYKHFED